MAVAGHRAPAIQSKVVTKHVDWGDGSFSDVGSIPTGSTKFETQGNGALGLFDN